MNAHSDFPMESIWIAKFRTIARLFTLIGSGAAIVALYIHGGIKMRPSIYSADNATVCNIQDAAILLYLWMFIVDAVYAFMKELEIILDKKKKLQEMTASGGIYARIARIVFVLLVSVTFVAGIILELFREAGFILVLMISPLLWLIAIEVVRLPKERRHLIGQG